MSSRLLSWLRAHPRLAEALACVLCVALGWVIHRPAAPRIEYRDRVQIQEKVVDRVVTKVVTETVTAESKERVTHKHVTIAPDGTKTIDVDTGIEERVDLHVGQVTNINLEHQATVVAERQTEMRKEPSAAPSYRLGGLAGLSTHGAVYGAEASLRVVGPIWIGAWALTAPAGGISLAVEW